MGNIFSRLFKSKETRDEENMKNVTGFTYSEWNKVLGDKISPNMMLRDFYKVIYSELKDKALSNKG